MPINSMRFSVTVAVFFYFPFLTSSMNRIITFGAHNETVCQSRCPVGKQSAIYISGKAGISDRITYFKLMGMFASYLCADVIVSPPCKILPAYHNHGDSPDCSSEWQDYVLLYQKHQCFRDVITTVEPIGIETKKYKVFGGLWKSYSNLSHVTRDFESILMSHSVNKSFIFKWYIQNPWDLYRTKFSLITAFNDHIMIQKLIVDDFMVNETASVAAQQIANDFLDKNNLTKNEFTTLHIRRTDRAAGCSSTPKDIDEYISKSFQNCSRKFMNTPLLFMTDDRNVEYLNNISHVIKSRGFNPIYLDFALRKIIAKSPYVKSALVSDNFFLFMVEWHLQFYLTKRNMFKHSRNCRLIKFGLCDS